MEVFRLKKKSHHDTPSPLSHTSTKISGANKENEYLLAPAMGQATEVGALWIFPHLTHKLL